MHQLAEFFEQGGFFMYVNLLCSVVAITLITDRAVYFLGKGALNVRTFFEQLRKLIQGGQIDKASRFCQGSDVPVAQVARAGLSKVAKGEAAVATAIEEAMIDATPELKKRIGVLWSLANIATLIGLLGTITGLIGAFAAVGKAAADQRSQILARNIAEAMNNTWFGLAIAATCMIGHVFLQAASKKQLQELESFTLRLENLLIDVIRHPVQKRVAESDGEDDGEPTSPARKEARAEGRRDDKREDRREVRSGSAKGLSEARTGRPARRPAQDEDSED